MMLSKVRFAIVTLLLIVAGAVGSQLPSLIKDLMFLHAARMYNEYQQRPSAPSAPAASTVPPK